MLIRLSLLSAGIYVASAVVLELVLMLVVRLTDTIIGMQFSRIGMAVLFGVIWFVSFTMSWRLLRHFH